ncbi:hypothetical protein EDB80DRAFT_783577 [Ilyonectria destructans]|nr:hypothetical protein EDB80DRAFT_783577 [Ilyonectria destructans]
MIDAENGSPDDPSSPRLRSPANRRIPVPSANPNSIPVGNAHDGRAFEFSHRSNSPATKPSSTNGDPNAPVTTESPRPDSSDSTPAVSVSQHAEPALNLHAIAAAAIRATARKSHEVESFASSIPGPVLVNDSHNEPRLQTGDVRPRFESLPTQPSATPKESCCPRAEGGKGFKRKNEMIRHGLVHNSPGYVCPFCPGNTNTHAQTISKGMFACIMSTRIKTNQNCERCLPRCRTGFHRVESNVEHKLINALSRRIPEARMKNRPYH